MSWSKLNSSGESTQAPQSIKILTLGNSFSENAHEYLYEIASSAGVSITEAYSNQGSATLAFYDGLRTSANTVGYYKTSSSGTSNGQRTLDQMITEENWDVIVLQQASSDSGVYSRFQPYLNNLISHIKSIATNPNLNIALHMTWAYSTDSTHSGFSNYGGNQLTMYNSITDAFQQAMQETGETMLIPSGTTIQIGRTSKYLSIVERELTVDGYHLSFVGEYMAGLTYFETLVASRFNLNIFSDVSYVPSSISKFHAFLAKLAAKNAAINPFNTTKI